MRARRRAGNHKGGPNGLLYPRCRIWRCGGRKARLGEPEDLPQVGGEGIWQLILCFPVSGDPRGETQMSADRGTAQINRYTEIGALGTKVRVIVKRSVIPLAGVLAFATIYLTYFGSPGASAFALIGVGTCLALLGWCTDGIGLPLLPLIVVQNLLIYGGPIVNVHENIKNY